MGILSKKVTVHIGGMRALEDGTPGPIEAVCERASGGKNEVIIDPTTEDVGDQVDAAIENDTLCKYCRTYADIQRAGYEFGYNAGYAHGRQEAIGEMIKNQVDKGGERPNGIVLPGDVEFN